MVLNTFLFDTSKIFFIGTDLNFLCKFLQVYNSWYTTGNTARYLWTTRNSNSKLSPYMFCILAAVQNEYHLNLKWITLTTIKIQLYRKYHWGGQTQLQLQILFNGRSPGKWSNCFSSETNIAAVKKKIKHKHNQKLQLCHLDQFRSLCYVCFIYYCMSLTVKVYWFSVSMLCHVKAYIHNNIHWQWLPLVHCAPYS